MLPNQINLFDSLIKFTIWFFPNLLPLKEIYVLNAFSRSSSMPWTTHANSCQVYHVTLGIIWLLVNSFDIVQKNENSYSRFSSRKIWNVQAPSCTRSRVTYVSSKSIYGRYNSITWVFYMLWPLPSFLIHREIVETRLMWCHSNRSPFIFWWNGRVCMLLL
jgi:hypothetical protein